MLGVALASVPVAAQQQPVVLTGATLIDGTGRAPVADAVVVLHAGRIVCVGGPGACATEAAAATPIELAGHWLLPGLVDAHVHYSQTGWADGRPDALDMRERFPYDSTVYALRSAPDRFYRSYLCAGVTATFDVGGFPWTWGLRRPAEAAIEAPHVAAAGPLLSTRDHWLNLPAERQFVHIESDSAAHAGSRYIAINSSDAIKVWFLQSEQSPEAATYASRLQLIGRMARQRGVPLIVHATNLWAAKEALRAGATLLVHSVENADVDDEFLALMRANDAVITPTLTVYQGYEQLRERAFRAQRIDTRCVDPATLAKAFLTDSLAGRPAPGEVRARRARSAARYAQMLRNTKRIHDAGITVALGTDAGNPLTLPGASAVVEAEAMVEAGLTPMAVIVAATRNGARAMRRGGDFGTVETGKLADLLVLAADPLSDIGNLRRVELVIRGGHLWTRGELQYR
ncbi:MAG: amidohydrolase family protein [Longimicrobiales bacterium]